MCDVMLACKDELHSGQSDLAVLSQVALHEMVHLCISAKTHRMVGVLPKHPNTMHLRNTYIHTPNAYTHHGASVT